MICITVINRLVLLITLLCVQLSFSQSPQGLAEWKTFRDAHPFHAQGIAISSPRASGERVLIIAEPPANVSLEMLKAVNPNLLGNLATARHPIGYDGWVEDVVITLPHIDSQQVVHLLEQLHQVLFGTSYKTYLLSFDAPGSPTQRPTLNLSVSAADLADWLLADGPNSILVMGKMILVTLLLLIILWRALLMVRRTKMVAREGILILAAGALLVLLLPHESTRSIHLRFTSLKGGPPLSAREILQQTKPGVFFSSVPGIVLWSIPRGEFVTKYPQFAREFVLDSDLIIGAVGSDKGLLIVGRERQAPIEWLPPLRVETIFLLASLNSKELGQSFERAELIAGRLRSGADWAPIYLTDSLIDTEFGSQLNMADQLLKSWSEHGSVMYTNFNYPLPPSFPFAKPLSEEVHADALTFNWNTDGFGYVSTVGPYSIYAINRTGALPVDYYSGANKALKVAEDQAYEYFAAQNDPNLVRVVQYAALHQIFSHFQVLAPKTSFKGSESVVPKRIINQILMLVRQLEMIQEADLKRVELKLRSIGVDTHLDSLLEAREALEFISKGDKDGLQRLSRALVYPRDFETRFRASQNPSDEDTVIAIASQLLSTNSSLVQVLFHVDTDVSFKSYTSESQNRTSSPWLHTPSVVLSRGRPKTVGGHNLAARTVDYQVDPSVAEGHIRIEEKDDKRTIFFNGLDQSKISRSVREVGRNFDAPRGTIEEIIRNNLRVPSTRQHSYFDTLQVNGAKTDQTKRGFQPKSLLEIVADN